MRLISAALFLSCLALTSAGAQSSRPEQQYQGINRSIGQQQRSQQLQQQNQFETNQLRQDMQRNKLFVPPPSGSGSRNCARGIGC